MALASRGARDMDDGAEQIKDQCELKLVRSQAVEVYTWAVAVAVTLTVIGVGL